MISYIEETYTNYTECKKCGGYCCKKFPGDFSPHNFGFNYKNIYNNILNGLKEGILTFHTRLIYKDRYEKDVDPIDLISIEIIVIRPAVKIKKLFGPCIFLTENGCKFSFKDRPITCKELLPRKNKTQGCFSKIPDVFNTLKWIGYQDMIKCLRSKYRKIRRNRGSYYE